MRNSLIVLLMFIAFAGCRGPAGSSQSSANVKRYPFQGKVIAVDRTAHKATIEHQAIGDYMPAMTMEFPIHADWIWNDLTPGCDIRAEFVVDNMAKEPYWLENVSIIAAPDPNRSPVDENFPPVGTVVPDFSLTNQDGEHISLKDFRGKALALTFIYSRCPLPEFCIRMSTNFSDLAKQLSGNDELRDKIRLLSISFDPENDTPEKLRSYGLGYLGKDAKPDFTVWQLAVGKDAEVRRIAQFFGLEYEVDPNDKTVINHSLRTAVIGPDGKVNKIFPDNLWTPDQLLHELEATLPGQQK
jgi:protein SCO1/2